MVLVRVPEMVQALALARVLALALARVLVQVLAQAQVLAPVAVAVAHRRQQT